MPTLADKILMQYLADAVLAAVDGAGDDCRGVVLVVQWKDESISIGMGAAKDIVPDEAKLSVMGDLVEQTPQAIQEWAERLTGGGEKAPPEEQEPN